MSKVGKRYARALFDNSSPSSLELLSELLEAVALAVEENNELRLVLANPSIIMDERQDCLKMVATALVEKNGEKLEEADKLGLLNFLTVVFQAGRISSLTEISSEFKRLVNALKQLVSIEIESAQPLTPEQIDAIKSTFGEKYKQLATTTIKEAPELLSGVRIKIGDTIVDSSIRGRLDSIRSQLLAS